VADDAKMTLDVPGLRKLVRTDSQVESRFAKLLQEWRSQTAFESVGSRVVFHPAFRAIVALGPQAIPLILKEMTRFQHVAWLSALADLTGEDPVKEGHRRNARLMTEDWIAWGKSNGLV